MLKIPEPIIAFVFLNELIVSVGVTQCFKIEKIRSLALRMIDIVEIKGVIVGIQNRAADASFVERVECRWCFRDTRLAIRDESLNIHAIDAALIDEIEIVG